MIRRLKKAALAAFGPLFVLAFVSGCVTSTEGSMESNDEEAAKYNTQLGATYLQRGMLEQAREKLEKAVEQDPDQASARAYLGVLYERIDEEKLAGKLMEKLKWLLKEAQAIGGHGSICKIQNMN